MITKKKVEEMSFFYRFFQSKFESIL